MTLRVVREFCEQTLDLLDQQERPDPMTNLTPQDALLGEPIADRAAPAASTATPVEGHIIPAAAPSDDVQVSISADIWDQLPEETRALLQGRAPEPAGLVKWEPAARIGDRVHYVAPGSADGRYPSVCRAATVTEVGAWIDQRVMPDPETPNGRILHQVMETDAVHVQVHNPTGTHNNVASRREDPDRGVDGVRYPPQTWHKADGCQA